MKVRRRFLHPLWLLVSLRGYLGWRLLPALAIGPIGVFTGITALLAACAIIPLSVNTRSMKNRALADRVAWIGLTTMGFFSSLFIVTLVRDIFLLGTHMTLPAE